MTNEALQALIAEYGDRILCLVLDNAHKVWFGCPASDGNINHVGDIQYKTVGGIDMFGIHHVSHNWGGIDVPYMYWIVTSFVQHAIITDELGDYLPDINTIF